MGTCPGTYTDPVSGLVCLFVAKWETDEQAHKSAHGVGVGAGAGAHYRTSIS